MKPATIPAFAALSALTACGGLNGGGAADLRVPPLDASIAAPCPHPLDVPTGGDWEIYAGRLGDELIACGSKHGVVVADREALSRVVRGE